MDEMKSLARKLNAIPIATSVAFVDRVEASWNQRLLSGAESAAPAAAPGLSGSLSWVKWGVLAAAGAIGIASGVKCAYDAAQSRLRGTVPAISAPASQNQEGASYGESQVIRISLEAGVLGARASGPAAVGAPAILLVRIQRKDAPSAATLEVALPSGDDSVRFHSTAVPEADELRSALLPLQWPATAEQITVPVVITSDSPGQKRLDLTFYTQDRKKLLSQPVQVEFGD